MLTKAHQHCHARLQHYNAGWTPCWATGGWCCGSKGPSVPPVWQHCQPCHVHGVIWHSRQDPSVGGNIQGSQHDMGIGRSPLWLWPCSLNLFALCLLQWLTERSNADNAFEHGKFELTPKSPPTVASSGEVVPTFMLRRVQKGHQQGGVRVNIRS